MDLNPAKRNIVILLDGTNNEYGERNSNIVKTMSVLKADDQQLLYYSSGIGWLISAHSSFSS
jgi:uncharacterized protein (DUF2235 family)